MTQLISIHSTTRVETNRKTQCANCLYISIHSTTRVETIPAVYLGHFHLISIHSTTRVETKSFKKGLMSLGISIHSTTRVETIWALLLHGRTPNFNPLHHEGGDRFQFPRTKRCGVFQSTPPRGWRRHFPKMEDTYMQISIHSTTRVETYIENVIGKRGGISIHSTTRVETAILHNNHYYSSTHFHKQIISHPLKSRPTIPAHSQIRSHCANFPVRISP